MSEGQLLLANSVMRVMLPAQQRRDHLQKASEIDDKSLRTMEQRREQAKAQPLRPAKQPTKEPPHHGAARRAGEGSGQRDSRQEAPHHGGAPRAGETANRGLRAVERLQGRVTARVGKAANEGLPTTKQY